MPIYGRCCKKIIVPHFSLTNATTWRTSKLLLRCNQNLLTFKIYYYGTLENYSQVQR